MSAKGPRVRGLSSQERESERQTESVARRSTSPDIDPHKQTLRHIDCFFLSVMSFECNLVSPKLIVCFGLVMWAGCYERHISTDHPRRPDPGFQLTLHYYGIEMKRPAAARTMLDVVEARAIA
jgi:hypothetical protein